MVTKQKAFTIVELLIVIVVIGILAAITLVAYNSIQAKAQQAKIDADLAQIYEAILAARVNNSSELISITQAGATEAGCLGAASGSDLKTNSTCVNAYNQAMDRISTASNINVRRMSDPWGRPYYINSNEGENQTSHLCMNDFIGVYSYPFVSGATKEQRSIPLYKSSCP